MPLSSQMVVQLSGTHTAAAATPDNGTFTPATHVASLQRAVTLATGTAAGQADTFYQDTGTLAASATIDLDLAGSLANLIGGTSVYVRIKGLYVSAAAANTNNVIVGNAATNPWATLFSATGTVTLRPGAAAMFVAGSADATGWTVTAGTGDLLRLANSAAGTSVDYTIGIIGCSA